MIGAISKAQKKDADNAGLPYDENYTFFLWEKLGRKIYFSGTRRGNAMEIHIATKNGQRMIIDAVNDFCESIFSTYYWCERVTGLVVMRGVLSLSRRCGFSVVGSILIDGDKVTIIERLKNGEGY